MPKGNVPFYALNRGEVSALALARIDVDRLRLSAETQRNWLPRVLGPAMLRPGLEYITSTKSDAACRLIPFIYSSTDTALLEFTATYLRPLVSEDVITRPTVTTTMSGFDTSAAWSTTVTGTASVSFTGSVLTMNIGSTGGVAKATQTVNLGTGSSGIEHAVRISVTRGPVKFRIGSTLNDDDLFATATLDDGEHSLAFTPTSSFYLEFEATTALNKIVGSIALESPGVVTLTTPYPEAALPKIRTEQSADVVYVACEGYQQYKVERRTTRSWSFVKYKTDDGPFDTRTDDTISITNAASSGNTVLTANKPLFKPTHVGALFRLFHLGQVVQASLSAADTFSDPIRITGVGEARRFTTTITGTWVGTLTLQMSVDGEDSGYVDQTRWTANVADPTNDDLDNAITWFRVGFKAGEYTSGTANIVLRYQGGGGYGVCRVLTYTNSSSVEVEVLDAFSNTTATRTWKEGAWSSRRGWPTSVALHEGRLWWAGNDRFWGSISDDYTGFDPTFEGDAGPIDRTIGQGPIARISWLASQTRLLAGADRSVVTARSSSFDEPLTPTNFNLKESSTQGAYTLPAVKVDNRVVYVQASNRRVYDLAFDVQIADYKPSDLTRLNDDIGYEGFVDLAVQRQPDTFIHFVRADGQVAVLLYDTQDNVEAWWRVETDGIVENVCVLPGTLEDKVYYVVKRTIGGVTKRFIERFARIDQCQGGTLCRLADSHVIYEGTAATTITGLDHLEGETVVVWADGADVGTKVVSGGSITLDTAASSVCAGLSYDATYISSKLAYAAAGGTALTQKKRAIKVGLVLAHTHYQGLRYGQDEDNLDPLPLVEQGKETAADTVWTAYDEDMIELNGSWDTDARLVLKAAAPRPCTVMGVVVDMQTNG